MTGRTDRIIHSGRVPERRNASIRRRRLIAFLRRWPELVRTSTWSARASVSRSIRLMMSRTASAPMPEVNRRPLPAWLNFSSRLRSSVSPTVSIGLIDSSSSRSLRSSSFRPWACSLSWPFSARERLVHRGAKVGDLLVDGGRLVALALLDLLVDALGLGADDGPQLGGRGLAALVAGGDDDLAGRLEDDRLLGGAGLELGEPGLDALGRGDDLLGAGGALRLELGLGRLERGRQLVAVALDVGLELGLELAEALAGLAAAAGGLLLDVRGEALAGLLVDARDDVQGEVQDPLEVAGADVEQDARGGWACP